MLKQVLKVALVQMPVGFNKSKNIAKAITEIHSAKEKGAQLVVLPEYFNSLFAIKSAEEVPSGETSRMLSKAAAEYGVCIVGGSLLERCGEKLYNTCTVWDDRGKQLATHRKMHLFDIDIPGTVTINESNAVSAGDKITTFEYHGVKVGLGICYDLCFPEMAHLTAKQGCDLLIYPGAFDTTFGPTHWESLGRARAIDQQLWVALVSAARDSSASYVHWGHTSIINPYGVVVDKLREKPGTIITDIVLKVALVQMPVGFNKSKNIAMAVSEIHRAKEKGAQLVVLPEYFNSPLVIKSAEEVPSGETSRMLSKAAAEYGVCIVGGSLLERCGEKLYNTCTVWDDRGKQLATHRKIHLFDVDIPDKITYKESEILSAGDSITTFEYLGVRIGLGVCYDLCYPELAQLTAEEGCELLIYPASFDMTFGPTHWESLGRARATEQQLWVALVSPSRDTSDSYVNWGHTCIINPSGFVVDTLCEKPGTIIIDIDTEVVDKTRSQIQYKTQRRTDLYEVVKKEKRDEEEDMCYR